MWHREEPQPAAFEIRSELTATISNPNHWLEGANLEARDLSDLDLTAAKLPNANLAECNLERAILDRALLESASLISSNLIGASLVDANLRGAVLNGANATKAHLERADLSGAHLEGFNVTAAHLRGLKLSPETASYGFEIGLPAEMLDGNFKDAASVFRDLSRHFRDVSDHQRSEFYYHLEMTALHLDAVNASDYPTGNIFQRAQMWIRMLKTCPATRAWLPWAMHRWVWGYGARPFRTLLWMMAVVIFFGACVFPIFGVELPNGAFSRDVFLCVTLSLLSFTSLGSAIRLSNGALGEILCGIEALVGVILSSLFIVALATRYIHRP